jgi:ABC-type transporter Mla subunit MlaD
MKFLVLALLVVSTLSLGMNHHKLSTAQVKQIENVKSQVTWGKVILELAELHMFAKGPLDELLTAIQNLISDLGQKTDFAIEQFDERTSNHNSLEQRLTDDINTAQVQIAHTETFLANVLYVAKSQLEGDIDQLHSNIDANNVHMQEITI